MEPLTITGTARHLRVTRFTVHRLLASDQLTAVNVGGIRHVAAPSVAAFVHANTVLPDRQEPSPMPTKELPDLYTLEEVVAMYPELSLRTLQDSARANKFEHVHFGRKRFMTADQIKRLIDDKTKRPASDDALASVRRRRAGRRMSAA